MGAVERGSVGVHSLIQLLVYLLIGSIITYRNSVDGTLSVIRLSSAKWSTRNARVILLNPRCLSPFFPATAAFLFPDHVRLIFA